MAENTRGINFAELVEARKEEMEGMLPGFYTTVELNGRSAKVYSKSASVASAPKSVNLNAKKKNK